MITLRIISASNLPPANLNGYSDPYVKVYAQNYGRLSPVIYKTKTVRKTLNPNWDEYIRLPFVVFDTSLTLAISDSNIMSDDLLLGKAQIFPSIQNFYRTDSQIQTAKIEIHSRFKEFDKNNSSLQYSIVPTITNFDFKEAKNPKKIFVYLSFDSFQPNSQENIHLFSYGMNRNGTLVDPIFDVHSRGDIEASHFSPNGVVQVFSFTADDSHGSGIYEGQYFFIVKATNFSGRLNLNFVSSPKNSSDKNYVDKFFIVNNEHSINIPNQENSSHFFFAFPVILKFVKGKCSIEPFKIPERMQKLTTLNASEEKEKLEQMSFDIGQLICPHDKQIHRRFEIGKFNRVSLNDAFEKCNLNHQPSKIDVAIGWDSFTDLDLIVYQVLNNGKILDPICCKTKKKADSSNSIKSGKDSKGGKSRGDDETTTIDLNKISSEIKCMLICITSNKGFRFDAVEGLFIRIVDSESKKEVMFMNLEQNVVIQETSFLWGILRKLDDKWNIWPCNRFMKGSNSKELYSSLVDFIKSGEFETIFTS